MRTVDKKLILDLISNFVSTWISKCNKHNLSLYLKVSFNIASEASLVYI